MLTANSIKNQISKDDQEMMLAEPQFRCPDPTCMGRAFKRLNHLHAHQTRVHGDRPAYRGGNIRPFNMKPVTCYTCNITFPHILEFRKHVQNNHQ